MPAGLPEALLNIVVLSCMCPTLMRELVIVQVIVQVIVRPPAGSCETCRREEEQTGLYPDWLCLAHAHASQVSTHLDVSPHLRLAEKNNNHDAADEIKSYLRVEDVKSHKRAKKHHFIHC